MQLFLALADGIGMDSESFTDYFDAIIPKRFRFDRRVVPPLPLV